MIRNIEAHVPSGIGDVLASQLEAAASDAISKTMIATKAKWEQTAQQRLKSTRMDYIMGLNTDDSVEFPDAFTGVLTLRGGWPTMLETGFPAFDMKQGFGRSSKRKMLSDGSGWYMTIPMRHQTPSSNGMAGGTPMPEDIYSRARALKGVTRLTGTEKDYPPGVSHAGYQHKSGIYEGMRKVSKDYAKATQSKYVSFRRVGSKSPSNSWMHPGFPGVEAINVVQPFAQRTLNKVLEQSIRDVME